MTDDLDVTSVAQDDMGGVQITEFSLAIEPRAGPPDGADVAVALRDANELGRPDPLGAEIGPNPVISTRQAAEPGPIVDRVEKRPGARRVDRRLAVDGLLRSVSPRRSSATLMRVRLSAAIARSPEMRLLSA